jgi:hypothetical protein
MRGGENLLSKFLGVLTLEVGYANTQRETPRICHFLYSPGGHNSKPITRYPSCSYA